MSIEIDLVRIAEFERHFSKILSQVEGLRAAMAPHEERYHALIARAAGGDDVADLEWVTVEAEILEVTRKAMRCFEILKHQQEEIAKINTELAAKAAEQIAKTFCFFSPVSGHA
jgi:hypothetical protein